MTRRARVLRKITYPDNITTLSDRQRAARARGWPSVKAYARNKPTIYRQNKTKSRHNRSGYKRVCAVVKTENRIATVKITEWTEMTFRNDCKSCFLKTVRSDYIHSGYRVSTFLHAEHAPSIQPVELLNRIVARINANSPRVHYHVNTSCSSVAW